MAELQVRQALAHAHTKTQRCNYPQLHSECDGRIFSVVVASQPAANPQVSVLRALSVNKGGR